MKWLEARLGWETLRRDRETFKDHNALLKYEVGSHESALLYTVEIIMGLIAVVNNLKKQAWVPTTTADLYRVSLFAKEQW